MGEVRQHRSRDVMQWVWDNADRPFTIDEVAKAIDWNSGSTATVLGRMVTDYPDQMERIRKGVYRWSKNGRIDENVVGVGDDIIVTVVLKEESGRMLVKEDGTGTLYLMTPFELPG